MRDCFFCLKKEKCNTQLTAVKGSPNVTFNKFVAKQLKDMWQAWEDEGLLHLVLTWAG